MQYCIYWSNFKNSLGSHVLYIFYSSFLLIWLNVILFVTVSESPNNTSAQTSTGWFRSRLHQQQQKYTCRFAHYSIIANFEYLFPLSSMCKFQVLETSSSCGLKSIFVYYKVGVPSCKCFIVCSCSNELHVYQLDILKR